MEFHALLSASVNMKRFTLLLGGDGVEVQAYLGFHWSQPGWKGQGHLLTVPYMASTVNTAGRDMEVASLLLDSGETSHFPPDYFWYQPSRRGLNILLPLMRVKVQVAHMFSIDVMLMSVWEGHIFTQWVWKTWVPIQPFLTLTLWEAGHLVTTRQGWKVQSPQLSSFWGDDGRTFPPPHPRGVWL